MTFSYLVLLSLLCGLPYIFCTVDVVFDNNAVGLENSVNIAFQPLAVHVNGADIHVTIPEFSTRGGSVNITSETLTVNVVKSVVDGTPLTIVFSVFDNLQTTNTYSFTISSIFSVFTQSVTAAGITVETREVDDMAAGAFETATVVYTGVGDYVYGAGVQDSPSTTSPSNTYFVADRSYLNAGASYVISSITLDTTGGTFASDNSASLKIFSWAPGATTLTFWNQTTFTIPAGGTTQTINFQNGPRPLLPSFALVGVYTSNNLALSTCVSPLCFGGHLAVAGNIEADQPLAGVTWGPQEVALTITRDVAQNIKVLSDLTISAGSLTFASGTFIYQVALSAPASVTVTPSVSASSGASFSIDRGTTNVPAGSYLTWTITVWAEDPLAGVNTYIVNVTVADDEQLPPFPCMGLIGTLNRVGFWIGDHFDPVTGLFDPTKCAISVKTLLDGGSSAWPYRPFPTKLVISSNYFRAGMFFGLLVAGAMPNPVPLTPKLPAHVPDSVTAIYIDQFGVNSTLSVSGGKFNFPNPDLAGNCKIILQAIVKVGASQTFITEYDIDIIVQHVSDVQPLNNNLGLVTVPSVVVGARSVLSDNGFGQFVITLATYLGDPFESWRMIVVDSYVDTDSNKPVIVVGFIDLQDRTRPAATTSAQLQAMFLAAYRNQNGYRAAMASTGYFDFSYDAYAYVDTSVTQVSPCFKGEWFLAGNIPLNQRSCGEAPDSGSGGSSSNKEAIADALVGVIVGGSCFILIGGFIYYKYISKNKTEPETGTGKGLELSSMPADSAPVAVPAAKLTADTPTNAGTTGGDTAPKSE